MNNRNLLTGTVMLETMWRTRHKDLIDLISPFVLYATASVTAPNQIIDKRHVLDSVRREFGLSDMNLSVIERVYRRNPGVFKKRKNEFTLIGSLDKTVKEINRRRDECDQRLDILGKQLSEFISARMKIGHECTSDDAVNMLQEFFSRQGVFLGTDKLEEHSLELGKYKTDYFISQYIYEKRDARAPEYNYIIDLVKGYFLQSAIYLQANNGNIVSSTYKNTTFYYDTPFLLRLLGYKAEEDNEEASELHESLKSQKGTFCFFPQTQREINGILTAYQRAIGKYSHVTLEGLDAKRYSPSDVGRLKVTWESKLASLYGIGLQRSPGYITRSDGTTDERYIIDEEELKKFLLEKINYKSDDSINADVESLINIHQTRGRIVSEEIEHVNSVFVTTNGRLARCFNQYYRENFNRQTFPLVITDSDLAALTWIKCGSTNGLPERQLLRNAYMATQPTPEILDKFNQVLERMLSEGKLTEELAVAIRSSRFVNKELLFASFDDDGSIDESLIERIEAQIKEDFSNDAREDERQTSERLRRKEHHERIAKAERQARSEARHARVKQLAITRRVATIIEVLLIICALIGCLAPLVSQVETGPCFLYFVIFVVTVVFSALSVVDTARGKEWIVDRFLVYWANTKYDKVYESKMKEYQGLIG